MIVGVLHEDKRFSFSRKQYTTSTRCKSTEFTDR